VSYLSNNDDFYCHLPLIDGPSENTEAPLAEVVARATASIAGTTTTCNSSILRGGCGGSGATAKLKNSEKQAWDLREGGGRGMFDA
jgi:hypothetical protein